MDRGRKLKRDSLQLMVELLRNGASALNDLADTSREYDKLLYWGIAKRLYNLGRGGYVRAKKAKGNVSFFHLTPKGRLAVLKYLHLEKLKIKKWDRHWRIVIFDVPEFFKKKREYLRRELLNLGFAPLQKSVYVTPYPVVGTLDEVLRRRRLKKYFRFLTADEIDKEDDLKEIFGLK